MEEFIKSLIGQLNEFNADMVDGNHMSLAIKLLKLSMVIRFMQDKVFQGGSYGLFQESQEVAQKTST